MCGGVDEPMAKKIDRAKVLDELAKVAFCKANDAVQLALQAEAPAERLRLDGVSKVKRGRDGSVEVEFCDRVRALQLLYELLGEEQEGLLDFLEEVKG